MNAIATQRNILEAAWQRDVRLGMILEHSLYAAASASIIDYRGGQWKPDANGTIVTIQGKRGAERVTLYGVGNGYEGATDMRSASAAVCLLTLNHLCWRFHERGQMEHARWFSDLWEAGRDEVYKDGSDFDVPTIVGFLD